LRKKASAELFTQLYRLNRWANTNFVMSGGLTYFPSAFSHLKLFNDLSLGLSNTLFNFGSLIWGAYVNVIDISLPFLSFDAAVVGDQNHFILLLLHHLALLLRLHTYLFEQEEGSVHDLSVV